MDQRRFTNTLSKFFEKANLKLLIKGEHYQEDDTDGLPSYFLLDRRRDSYYITETDIIPDDAESEKEIVEAARYYGQKTGIYNFAIEILLNLGRELRDLPEDYAGPKGFEFGTYRRKCALVVSEPMVNDMERLFEHLELSTNQTVPLKGAFKSYFFDVDTTEALLNSCQMILDSHQDFLMNPPAPEPAPEPAAAQAAEEEPAFTFPQEEDAVVFPGAGDDQPQMDDLLGGLNGELPEEDLSSVRNIPMEEPEVPMDIEIPTQVSKKKKKFKPFVEESDLPDDDEDDLGYDENGIPHVDTSMNIDTSDANALKDLDMIVQETGTGLRDEGLFKQDTPEDDHSDAEPERPSYTVIDPEALKSQYMREHDNGGGKKKKEKKKSDDVRSFDKKEGGAYRFGQALVTTGRFVTKLLFFLPLTLLEIITRGYIPPFVLSWLAALATFFGIYTATVGIGAEFLYKAVMPSATLHTMQALISTASLPQIASVASQHGLDWLFRSMNALVGNSLLSLGMQLELARGMTAGWALKYLAAGGFAIAMFPALRATGKRVVAFAVALHILMPVLVLMQGYAASLAMQDAPAVLQQVKVVAQAGNGATQSMIADMVARHLKLTTAVFAAGILIPGAVLFLMTRIFKKLIR